MNADRPFRRYPLAILCVFTIGVAVRLLPLYWTPYPFNPDGFLFVAAAHDSIAAGSVPSLDTHRTMEPHRYAFVLLLAVLSQLTGLDPIWIAQPTVAIIGTIPALLALLLVRQLGLALEWPARRTVGAATLAGFVLAVEGLYLRRSVAVSYEVLGLLLVPAVTLCLHRFLQSSRRSWLVVTGVLLLALPVTHHLSTMIAAVTLTVLVASRSDRRPGWSTLGAGVGITAGFWVYLLTYYARYRPPQSDLVTTNPALFVAWLVVIVAIARWIRTASPRSSRGAIACVYSLGFGILALNAVQPVFPGMSSTLPGLLVLIAPLTVPVVLAIWGLPIVVRLEDGQFVLAILVAPLAFIGLGLTSGLSPQFTMLVQRTQTFVHLGTAVVMVVAAFVLRDRVRDRSGTLSTAIRIGLPLTLALVAVVTMPVAFAGLEALSYQGTTEETEFAAATFASTTMTEPWTSDDHITRIERNYHGSTHNAGQQPVHDWLQGGDPPSCPTIAQDSWTADGAQLYPAPPERLTAESYDDWHRQNTVIYSATDGDEGVIIVAPPGGSAETC